MASDKHCKVWNELLALEPILRNDLSVHLATLRNDPEVYGYAVLMGEDIHQCSATAVTNRESDLTEHIGTDYELEARYLPDEWQHYDEDALTLFNEQLDRVYREFRTRHPENYEESFSYDDEEVRFLEDVYEIYLRGLKTCRDAKEFGPIWYRVMWISQSGRSIMKKSFLELNDSRAIDEASEIFDDI